MNKIINEDEMNALLSQADEVLEKKEREVKKSMLPPGFDFASPEENIKNKIAALSLINEKFSRNMKGCIYHFLRKTANVRFEGIKTVKFNEYISSFIFPTSLNIVKMSPLKGKMLFMLDNKLIFLFVESFFGGEGKIKESNRKEFTPSEIRVIKLALDYFFKELKEAWAPVLECDFEYIGMESNPAMVTLFSPAETMVVVQFKIELEKGAGAFHIAMPYTLIEPIKALLNLTERVEKEATDKKWGEDVKKLLLDVKIVLNCILAEKKMTLKEILHLKEGEIIHIHLPEEAILTTHRIALYKGNFGTFEKKYAIKVSEKVK